MNLGSILLLGAGALLMSACDQIKSMGTPAKIWLDKVTFQADEDMNDSSPAVAHVVFLYTDELLKEVGKLDSASYFKKIDTLKSDHPEDVEVFKTDVIPGRKTELEVSPSKTTAAGAFVFVRYTSAGDHRQAVGGEYETVAKLGKSDFVLKPAK